MPIKYVPYSVEPVAGQAVLNNFNRVLKYKGSSDLDMRIERGMPYYTVESLETVGNPDSGNLVIRGECVSACAYLKDQGIKVDLVYIDPPFMSGANYAKEVVLRQNHTSAMEAKNGREKLEIREFQKFEEVMYGDIWTKEKYLSWMYENLLAIRTVMSEDASIFVHLDWHIGHYVKIIMDEIFGENSFVNEIIWHYPGREMHVGKFNAKHDSIFFYSLKKNGPYIDSKAVATTYGKEERLKTLRRKVFADEDGREWVWETRGQSNGQEPYKRYVDEMLEDGKALDDVWSDIPSLRGNDPQRNNYTTEKPPGLADRIIKASTSESMIVADFFGGSGGVAAVSSSLNRKFIHVDIGVNSIQTTRDRLISQGASFNILEINDGVSLFRNPIQTMEKLRKSIIGLKNEEGLDKFWEGAISDPKYGTVPVYIPDLTNSTTKILDIAFMGRIIHEAIPDLDKNVRRIIVYYVDITSIDEINEYIGKQDSLSVEIELRDLKSLLDDLVIPDEIEYEYIEDHPNLYGHSLRIVHFYSDAIDRRIKQFNLKSKQNNRNGTFVPITLSENGLELIELISLDFTNNCGPWHSDYELKIDSNSNVIRNGEKSKDLWDGTVPCQSIPLRIKVRNICGDETIFQVESAGL